MKTTRLLVAAAAISVFLGCSGNSDAGARSQAKMETEEEKTLYALGVAVANNTLGSFQGMFSPEEIELIKRGFGDGLTKEDPLVEMSTYGPKLNTYLRQRVEQAAEEEKAKGRAYLEQAAEEEGAIQTESGLVYKELRAGTGPHPTLTDTVEVHYKGSLIDGTVFDSSIERGTPIVHPVNGFVPGWREGLQMMKVGGKARLVVPPELAYGDRQVGEIPPGSTLVFEIELLGIK